MQIYLCLFDNPNEVFTAAIALQEKYQLPPEVPVRIGIHQGEVFFDDSNAYSNAINIASRIESISVAGAITCSA